MQSLTLAFSADRPLYQQLYTRLAHDIRAGQLCAGERLPSKRRLAEQLHISVNTVDTAYQMLAAEGYIAAKPRSGFVVCRLERLSGGAGALPAETPGGKTRSATGGTDALAAAPFRYNFETGSIDTSLFPFKTWRRLAREMAGSPALLNHGPRQGDEDLRGAIAAYLHEFRGAQCAPEQIVVGAGIEYLLGLLARLFSDAVFAVEDPGYARTHRILENNGVRVSFIPVDGEGMQVTALENSPAQLAYITPSHQFPTGVTMPVGRRTELLRWAAQGAALGEARYLIEDDYDSEFRFDGKPLPAVQGLDDGTHVLYISTFSKSIAPSVRIAYMVLPPALLARYQADFGFYSCTVSRFEQQTLCRFIREGHFARHLARLRIAYRQRRDALVTALRTAFGEAVEIRGSHTGLHLLIRLVGCGSERQLVEAAAARGVRVTGLSAYYADSAPRPAEPSATLVLGYAGLAAEEIDAAVCALREACTAVQNGV